MATASKFEMSEVDRLKDLVSALEDKSTFEEAARALHALADALESGGARPGTAAACLASPASPAAPPDLAALADVLSLRVIPLPGREKPLRLLLHRAVFSPEEWAKTFAEGLLKEPQLFSGRKLAELGTGSGWISLLLLKRTLADEILGLDINPIAVMIARLNAFLNGTASNGKAIKCEAGAPIFKAFDARESDLLGEPLSRKATFDHIIGCIPQVLHPDPSKLASTPKEFSEKDLYDLSNYCFQQGILEDKFGLPLIARALEEAQLCLNPGGKVILILGGRPGPQAIDAMFRRRGWEPRLIWSRRIQQADDTDLCSLVEIERIHNLRFHFFLSRESQLSVSAETAMRVLGEQQPVHHDLLVYQAETRCELPTLGFVRNLHSLGLDDLRRELDFSRMSEELVSFLDRFSDELMRSRTLPYPSERGDRGIRHSLSRFLRTYCYYPISSEDLFIAPERSALVSLILPLVLGAGDQVLLSRSLEDVYRAALEEYGIDVVVGNDDLAELNELDDLLAPKAVIIAPSQLAQPSPITLDRICEQARKHPESWYIVDDSAQFNIGSELSSNMTIRLAGQKKLPENLVFLYGLVKNTVFPDYELSFLLNAPLAWSHLLEVGAELTYSRIPFQVQLYYQWLFEELLAFPFPESARVAGEHLNEATVRVPAGFTRVAGDPVFQEKPISLSTSGLIRFDYGEVEAPVPELLIKGLFKGFFEQGFDSLPALMRHRVAAYLEKTRGVSVDQSRIVLGNGVFPLLGVLVRKLADRLGRKPVVALPRGSYGPLYPMIEFHGGEARTIETNEKKGFLLDPSDLARLDFKPDLLWLTQPNNPSGLFFDSLSVKEILRFCFENKIYLMADEIFHLLSDHRLGEWTPSYLSFLAQAEGDLSRYLFVTDGLSKAFAAGGMRCGYMVTPDCSWSEALERRVALPARSTLRAWDALYSAFLTESPHLLLDVEHELSGLKNYLMSLRKSLAERRDRLLKVFREQGVDDGLDTPYRGGIFMLARLSDEQERLAREKALLINKDAWSRTPGWSRVSFSVPDDKFEEGLKRLAEFLS